MICGLIENTMGFIVAQWSKIHSPRQNFMSILSDIKLLYYSLASHTANDKNVDVFICSVFTILNSN